MSEQGNGKGQRNQQQGGERSQQEQSSLQSDRGNTSIQDSVVSQVAGIAAQEVEGVRMGGGVSQRASGLLSSVTGGRTGGANTQGVSVEVGQEETAIDLTTTIEYGRSVPQIAEAVRRNVVNRVESLVGLRVNEVNIVVSDIFFAQEEESQQQIEGEQGQSQQSRSRGS